MSNRSSPTWSAHVDGYVCGEIGVFPFFFGAWEVWEKKDGEWQEVKGLEPFEDIEIAKSFALDWASKPEADDAYRQRIRQAAMLKPLSRDERYELETAIGYALDAVGARLDVQRGDIKPTS